jgi:hypothetical protein
VDLMVALPARIDRSLVYGPRLPGTANRASLPWSAISHLAVVRGVNSLERRGRAST